MPLVDERCLLQKFPELCHICICITSCATYKILTWPCYLGWEVLNILLYTTVNRTACATMNLQTVKDLAHAVASDFAFTSAKMAEMRSTYSKSQCCHAVWARKNDQQLDMQN